MPLSVKNSGYNEEDPWKRKKCLISREFQSVVCTNYTKFFPKEVAFSFDFNLSLQIFKNKLFFTNVQNEQQGYTDFTAVWNVEVPFLTGISVTLTERIFFFLAISILKIRMQMSLSVYLLLARNNMLNKKVRWQHSSNNRLLFRAFNFLSISWENDGKPVWRRWTSYNLSKPIYRTT